MARRAVNCVLVACLLLMQLTAAPHCHGCERTPADHDGRPHVHLDDLAGHHHHGHHHHHAAPATAPHPALACPAAPDHDEHALYLPDNVAANGKQSKGPTAAVDSVRTPPIQLQLVTRPHARAEAADPGGSRPLYVLHSSLQI